MDIEWQNCIEKVTGNVETKGEEYAYIKLEVKVGEEENVINILQNEEKTNVSEKNILVV